MFWKTFHLILMHFYFLYSMLWGMFSKIQFFSFLLKKRSFSRFSIDPFCFLINRNIFKKFLWASVWFDWSNCFSINRTSWIKFFKKRILTFSKVFQVFSLSPIQTWLHLRFLSFFIFLFARFLSPNTGKTLLPFFLC